MCLRKARALLTCRPSCSPYLEAQRYLMLVGTGPRLDVTRALIIGHISDAMMAMMPPPTRQRYVTRSFVQDLHLHSFCRWR